MVRCQVEAFQRSACCRQMMFANEEVASGTLLAAPSDRVLHLATFVRVIFQNIWHSTKLSQIALRFGALTREGLLQSR